MSSRSVAAAKRVRIKNAYAGASKDFSINPIQDKRMKFMSLFDSSDPSYIIAYAGASKCFWRWVDTIKDERMKFEVCLSFQMRHSLFIGYLMSHPISCQLCRVGTNQPRAQVHQYSSPSIRSRRASAKINWHTSCQTRFGSRLLGKRKKRQTFFLFWATNYK